MNIGDPVKATRMEKMGYTEKSEQNCPANRRHLSWPLSSNLGSIPDVEMSQNETKWNRNRV